MERDELAGKVAKTALNVAAKAVGFDHNVGGIVGMMLTDQKGWDPVVPEDLHANPLPPVAADGTAECWQCKARLPFSQLDIAGNAYACRPCMLRTAQANASVDAASVDVDNVKIGRGRWWISVLIAAAVIGLIVAIFFVTKSQAK